MSSAKYVNFNLNQGSGLSAGDSSSGLLSRIKSAGGNLNTTTIVIIIAVLLFSILAGLYYYYYIAPKMKAQYHPNSEQVPLGTNTGNSAELLFFYADWCPHCKTAKPIWNDLKSEYENKTINGYKVIFTDINCSEETAEVDKMMNQYSVEGYPTIKLLKDGQIIEYDAKPSKDTLTQFLNTVL
jgi:thiol-disulfide isomerase/thioredoxin